MLHRLSLYTECAEIQFQTSKRHEVSAKKIRVTALVLISVDDSQKLRKKYLSILNQFVHICAPKKIILMSIL